MEKSIEKYREEPYASFQGERGFDDMDDHITDNILRDRKHCLQSRDRLLNSFSR